MDVWNRGLLETSLGRIFVALGIILGAILVRKLFVRIVIGRLRSLTGRTQTRFDDEALDVLERPIALVPVVVGVYFAVDYLGLSGGLQVLSDRIEQATVQTRKAFSRIYKKTGIDNMAQLANVLAICAMFHRDN